MPKRGSDYAPRPALPAGSRALDPKLVVAAALVPLFRDGLFEEAVEVGDTELRDALLHLIYSRLMEEAEAAQAEVETTGLTMTIAERVIDDRRERQRQEEIYGGQDWFMKREKAESDLRKRAGQKAAKRSAA
jgi:hypothetical protein